MSTIDTTTRRPSRLRGVLVATVLAAVIGSIANAIIAVSALAAGADPAVQGLTPPAYITFTVVGVLIGAIGWALISRARSAGRVLAILVPVVLVLSLIPDVLLAVSGGSAAMTAGVALGIMHLVTTAIAVPIYRVFLPIAR
ncbi:hypothetical protein DEI81_10975 [Curtobacterium sp. MCBD17_013]|uniref:DUF6069 family protein n=1 Tax=unclassified Curtobacterium TaxID=257496 RepID=UPI000DA7F96C|nr:MULTISPECIES: DUF6069 family protein [unclassified Curtobacterium]PZE64260.1 hypothetical protein DEI83_12005 [Curtobacterium sp. MCBD17_021]PZF61554.1 hypothetical protein DEI81_10975 [Curtobacterium sp. MCBD17_013]WIE54605.1 DUF6069 family protein [Curtobacterium sp. MCBD17_003]